MHELVIVVSDLYLPQDAPERELPPGIALPGLQQAARFGTRARVADGWRSWLAQWLGADQQARPGAATDMGSLNSSPGQVSRSAAPATVAAAAVVRTPQVPTELDPPQWPTQPAPTQQGPMQPAPTQQPSMVWMATPVHLVAGLTSVHLDRRSILRLSADDLTALATEFRRVFHDSGFLLEPLASGDFLLFGPKLSVAQTSEPARAMGSSVADVQPVGASEPTLRRLGAEVEMWLHEHPVNNARSRRGEAPVTGLWFWGGGPAPHGTTGATVTTAPAAAYDADTFDARGARATREALAAHNPGAAHGAGAALAADATPPDIAFGRDAYLEGLWASIGQKVFPLPHQLAEVLGYPHARRTALVLEIGPMLHSNPRWTFFDAVAHIDRAFIVPAIEALRTGKLARLAILANDRQLTLRARDRFKRWRPTPPGLSGLQ